MLCPRCGVRTLLCSAETAMKCCLKCHRNALLLGSVHIGEKMVNLTDEQIARLFELCNEISAVKRQLPAAPEGFDVSLESARNLRVSLTLHAAALAELAEILKPDAVVETRQL